MRRSSLSQRVTLFVTLALGVVWLVAVALMTLVLWWEQDELFDQQLESSAKILLFMLSQSETGSHTDSVSVVPQADYPLDEAVLFRIFAADGRILSQSALVQDADLPEPAKVASPVFSTTAGYRIYTTAENSAGHALQIAAPLAERREALRESMLGFLLPMLALLPLTGLFVSWMTRRALRPMRRLRAEIAARDGERLDAIDALDWPSDLVRIAGSLNRFMARLSRALDAERAFATNAAHELRTPVAVALAQVQQLRKGATDARQAERIDALERALQRMKRLVARLLQLARADAGIGASDQAHDLVSLTRLVLDEASPRLAASGRIVADLPAAPVTARIDPDAFAIVLGNLVDNALQHSPAASPIRLRLRPGAVIEVENEGPAIPETEQAGLTRRFARRGGEGFGLGLHICTQIMAGAGGQLELISPLPGREYGFLARISLPGAG